MVKELALSEREDGEDSPQEKTHKNAQGEWMEL